MVYPFLFITTIASLLTGNSAVSYITPTSNHVRYNQSSIVSTDDYIRSYDLTYEPTDDEGFIEYYFISDNIAYDESLIYFNVWDEFDYGNDTYMFQFYLKNKFDNSSIEGNHPNVTDFSNIHVLLEYSNSFGYNHSFFIENITQYWETGYTSNWISCYDAGYYENNLIKRYHHVTFTIMIDNHNCYDYYDYGYTEGANDNQYGWRLDNYLFSIVDIPVLYLKSFFDFELFGGVSIYGILLSLFTIAIAVFILRKMF